MDSQKKGSSKVLGLLLVAVAGVSWWWWFGSSRPAADPPPASQSDAPASQDRYGGKSAPMSGFSPADSRPQDSTTALMAKAKPRDDDWESEALGARASDQLQRLAVILTGKDEPAAQQWHELATTDVRCSSLRPAAMKTVYERAGLLVLRGSSDQPATHEGGDSWAQVWSELRRTLQLGGKTRVKFKVVSVEGADESLVTRLRFEASGHGPQQHLEQLGEWQCEWLVPAEAQAPLRIRQLKVLNLEEVHWRAEGLWFGDATAAVLAGNECYLPHLSQGISAWLDRVPRLLGMSIYGHHGLAVGDVDGDGLEDLYVCDAGGLPNRLFRQQPDGTALDASAAAGVDFLDYSTAALLIDVDNDGDQDLVVATRPNLLVAENNGQGSFQVRYQWTGLADPFSLAAADFDRDRDLDVYVCVYNPEPGGEEIPGPLPYHDANNGGQNFLLANQGDFQFKDVTAEVGLDQNNTRFSFAAAWEDYDNDGDLDLYVANDFGRNSLYQNDAGHFVDVAPDCGVEDIASGMSVAWGDYDRNGWMDVYVSNMFSAAGNRVTYQRRFEQGRDQQTTALVQRMARGNTLFANAGDGSFTDESVAAAVTMGRWSWASRFADLNNDGWQDLVVTNGYFSEPDRSDL